MSAPSRAVEPGTPLPHASARTFGVFIAGICAFLALYVPQPILPHLAQVFHVGKAAVGRTPIRAELPF